MNDLKGKVFLCGAYSYGGTASWFVKLYKFFQHHLIAWTLRRRGYEVISPIVELAPADLLGFAKLSQSDYMAISDILMSRCQYIYKITGWQKSSNCKVESIRAIAKGLAIID